jgi:hypothetical protein
MHGARHVISRLVDVEVVGPRGRGPGRAELRYDPVDPYAVALVFLVAGAEVTWVFARDLLLTGVSEPAGEGDVQVQPSLDDDGRAGVTVLLHSPSGDAVVKFAAADLLGFLARSAREVWPGTESDRLCPDAAIEALLVGD